MNEEGLTNGNLVANRGARVAAYVGAGRGFAREGFGCPCLGLQLSSKKWALSALGDTGFLVGWLHCLTDGFQGCAVVPSIE